MLKQEISEKSLDFVVMYHELFNELHEKDLQAIAEKINESSPDGKGFATLSKLGRQIAELTVKPTNNNHNIN